MTTPADAPQPQLNSLYQQLILEHYRSPKNKGELEDADAEAHLLNPSCGDEIHLRIKVQDGVLTEVKHTGVGCSINQSAISMLSEIVKGKPVDEAMALVQRFTAMMHGDEEAAKDRSLGNLRALAGVAKFPVRVKCALLGFEALQETVKKLEE